MEIVEKPLDYYLDRIARRDYFSFAGYSDAEWFCILGNHPEGVSGLGQTLDVRHGQRLLEILKWRQKDPRFLFAVPKVLYTMPGFTPGKMDKVLRKHGITITAYERDMVTDDLAAAAGLHPLIEAIRNYKGARVLIGNHDLEPMHEILNLNMFVGVSSPNLHMEPGGIESAVETAQVGPGLYLVSAGVSAAVIIDQLHDRVPESFLIDCGSIWDAFVGIGGQRQWRAELYANPEKLEAWKRKNLEGA